MGIGLVEVYKLRAQADALGPLAIRHSLRNRARAKNGVPRIENGRDTALRRPHFCVRSGKDARTAQRAIPTKAISDLVPIRAICGCHGGARPGEGGLSRFNLVVNRRVGWISGRSAEKSIGRFSSRLCPRIPAKH